MKPPMEIFPGQPGTQDQKPVPRGQRVAIIIEDILIVLAVVFLMVMVFFQQRGTAWTVGMYITLVVMAIVAVRRFLRIKKASEPERRE
jgi:membrane protein implicated in regulation of membrane protease activity